jgi:hypothetical protein
VTEDGRGIEHRAIATAVEGGPPAVLPFERDDSEE